MEGLTLQPFDFEAITLNRAGAVTRRERLSAQQLTQELGPDIVLEMVAIPAGAFLMGSPEGHGYDDERLQHRVAVAAFLLCRYLVTQAQWAAVMGEEPLCRFRGPRLPVDSVSWDSAQEFCRRLAEKTGRPYRLPGEAEWEYACRAGTTTPFACGPTITTELANYNGQFTYAPGALASPLDPMGLYRHVSTEVGSFPPNAFGLCDMHGNLWEWCLDPWHEDYRGAPADGRAWEAGGHKSLRVLRGGSWHDTPNVCRSAVRLKLPYGDGDDFCGFRVALEGSVAFQLTRPQCHTPRH